MSGLTQKLPQLELVIDDQANVAYILFTEMASRLVISTVFLCHERIWVSLERIIVVITFRATLNWFLLFFAMIGDFLLFLVVFDLRTKHVIHNVRDISIFIEMHSILGGLKLLITLNFYIQNSLRSVARNRWNCTLILFCIESFQRIRFWCWGVLLPRCPHCIFLGRWWKLGRGSNSPLLLRFLKWVFLVAFQILKVNCVGFFLVFVLFLVGWLAVMRFYDRTGKSATSA